MQKNILVTTIMVGLIASITFILVQPLFGMQTLTSRHAAAYIAHGGYGDTTALILSWGVHVGVSLVYTLLSVLIFNFNRSVFVSLGQIMFLGWATTLTATPANEWVVKLVNTKQFPSFDTLSALNTQTGPKLWLHILFFAFVVGGIWVMNRKDTRKQRRSF
ncbi:hypothetical protein [Kiloniella antarctica]|uniref:DUF1772 domain-containing protein n=1 Tax=Kiloniella antarctica TaxID=1550907 RepID=A0ABW5BF58_9PROT